MPARDDPAARHAKKLEHSVDGLIARCEIERIKLLMEERNDGHSEVVAGPMYHSRRDGQ